VAEPVPEKGLPPMGLDHHQLEKQAAPGFGEVRTDLYGLVKRAGNALSAIGSLPNDEEVDQRFLQWFAPKRDQMLALADDLAGAYGDIGEGVLGMSQNVKTIDWGLAKSLEKVPDYLIDGPVKRSDS
jgi:hypothetical protein